MAVTVEAVTHSAFLSTVNPHVVALSGWPTPAAGDFVIVIYTGYGGRTVSSITGLGATFASRYASGNGSIWVGTGANATGSITVTQNATGAAQISAFLVRGLASATDGGVGQTLQLATGAAVSPTAVSAGNDQIVFSWVRAQDATLNAYTYPASETPSGGWTVNTTTPTSTQGAARAYRIPTTTQTNHVVSADGDVGDSIQVWHVAIGTYSAPASGLSITDVTAAATAAGHVESVSMGPPAPISITDVTAAATAAGHVETVSLSGAPISITDVTATATAAGHVETVTLGALPPLNLTDVTAAATAAAYVENVQVGNGLFLTDVPAAATATAYVESVDFEGESVSTHHDDETVDDLVFVSVTADTPLDMSVPIMRQSFLMPELTEAHPVWHARKGIDAVDEAKGWYPVTEEAVGHVQVWVGHQNVTNFRGQETIVRRYDSELPWGDKTAMIEFPQMNPWEKPGEGDWSFLHRDAPVLIGIVESDGGAIRRLWGPGFLDARGSGRGEQEDYTFEAKGPMWALMHQIHEPRTYQPPEDIGSLIPDLVNNSRGRRFPAMPKVVTGRKTRKRGARDQPLWRLIQDILAVDGWTEDGASQWTIKFVGETPTLALKTPLSTVDAYFSSGNPNIDDDLRFDYSTACDVVWARGIAPGGGAWAHIHFPGLELLQGLPYPNADAGVTINEGDSDADTDSGTGVSDWMRKAQDLGFGRGLTVTGVLSAAWADVVGILQDSLDLTRDESIGPQTWTATFDDVDESIDLTPLRLPLARKPWAWATLHNAKGVVTGPNPYYDDTLVPREVALDFGPNVPKYPDGLRYARTYLAIHGEPKAFGTFTFVGCPDNIDRTQLEVGMNIEDRGYEGEDVVVQIASMTVELGDGTPGGFVVTCRVDNGRRDALTVEQLLSRDRDALPDPARRPGNPNRSSRQVKDEGFTWDDESPCGVLSRMAINGERRLWSAKTIPFAEVGQLAGIVLTGTFPWAMALFASLRITPNILKSIQPDGPFTADPWRPIMATLEDDYLLLAAWGEAGDRCGYSRGTQRDGYPFTGLFREASTLEYVTETVPYVKLLATMDGTSGFLEGAKGFRPAYQT